MDGTTLLFLFNRAAPSFYTRSGKRHPQGPTTKRYQNGEKSLDSFDSQASAYSSLPCFLKALSTSTAQWNVPPWHSTLIPRRRTQIVHEKVYSAKTCPAVLILHWGSQPLGSPDFPRGIVDTEVPKIVIIDLIIAPKPSLLCPSWPLGDRD